MRRLTTSSLALIAIVALLMASIVPVMAQGRDQRSLTIYHGPVEVSLVSRDSDGHQLGDLRVTSVATTTEDGAPLGRLDATLTTTSVDLPAAGDEIRTSTLVFSFDDEAGSQLVVSGSAAYPAEGPTIAASATTVRPIVGGSGGFAGASGEATTTHRDDGEWTHEFVFDRGKASGDYLRKAAKAKPGLGVGRDKGVGSDKGVGRDKGVRRGAIDVDAGLASGPEASASAEVGITRTDLGIAQPATAPGLEMGLWHYTIPAGSELPPHTHAGWQIAHIAGGELTYTIISGEGTLIAADGSSRQVGPGTYQLEAGDAIVENPDLKHYGANLGDSDVAIVAATLYTEGAPLSLPLEPAASHAPVESLEPAA